MHYTLLGTDASSSVKNITLSLESGCSFTSSLGNSELIIVWKIIKMNENNQVQVYLLNIMTHL